MKPASHEHRDAEVEVKMDDAFRAALVERTRRIVARRGHRWGLTSLARFARIVVDFVVGKRRQASG